MVLVATLAVVAPVAEIFRLSFIDQVLARATQHAARAGAAVAPSNCPQEIRRAFEQDRLALWLFDQDNNKILQPDEVEIEIVADDDLFDGVPWEVSGACGTGGSWIEVRSSITVEPYGIRRQHESWARNQT